MLTAIVNVGWDLGAVIEPIRQTLFEQLETVVDLRRRDDIAYYLEEVVDYLAAEHPYGMCHSLLEALAVYHEITGPDRIEITGFLLCGQFRRVYPNAPDGFERVGRMRQPPLDLLGLLGRVEPVGDAGSDEETASDSDTSSESEVADSP